jgi:hypothetical protein
MISLMRSEGGHPFKKREQIALSAAEIHDACALGNLIGDQTAEVLIMEAAEPRSKV